MLNESKRFIFKILSEMVLWMFLKTLVLTLSFLSSIRFNHVNLPVAIYMHECSYVKTAIIYKHVFTYTNYEVLLTYN